MNLYEFIYSMTLHFTFMGLIMLMISAFIMYMTYNYIIDSQVSSKGEIDTWIKQIQSVGYGLRDNEGSQGSQGSQSTSGFDLEKS
jgi:hypothetical protein